MKYNFPPKNFYEIRPMEGNCLLTFVGGVFAAIIWTHTCSYHAPQEKPDRFLPSLHRSSPVILPASVETSKKELTDLVREFK